MVTIKIKISTANEAFDSPGPEIARILRKIDDAVSAGVYNEREYRTHDVNGNTVGSFKYTTK